MFENDLQEFLKITLAKGFAGHTLFVQERAAERLDAWKQGADQGDPVAQYFVGLCHNCESVLRLDPAEALKYFKMSAEQGFAPAQAQFALHFEEGSQIKHDMDEALRWYTRSAE